MDQEILDGLTRQYPNVRLTGADQPLSEADFQAQKHKHFSRRALGGAIGIISNAKGEIVLVKRSGMHAGWALPGGTVEEGEDFSVAFRREIVEEIGVSLDVPYLTEVERKKFISPQGETFDFLLAVFEARMHEEELPEPTDDAVAEGLEACLFYPAEIPSEMILGDREKLTRYLRKSETGDPSP
jgi:ADP-ribose pyrophosphatase YjhB (NUDIX family)